MDLNVNHLALFTVSLALALIGTPIVRALASRLGIVDQPSGRKFHRRPTPLLGGVAIFSATGVGLVVTGWLGSPAIGAFLGGLVIVLLGFIDDLYQISAKLKLAGQIFAAALVLPFGMSAHTTGNDIIDAALTIFWIVGITNAMNLLDNMDGLAAGTAAIAAFGLFLVAHKMGQAIVAGAAIALCGACLGFLRYNFGRKPARIFMGDTGSLFLGYLLAVMAVRLSYNPQNWLAPLLPITIMALPIFDTTLVTVTRLLAGQPITKGGKDHCSHRLVAAFGLSSKQAVGVLWLAALSASMASISVVFRDSWIIWLSRALAFTWAVLMIYLSWSTWRKPSVDAVPPAQPKAAE